MSEDMQQDAVDCASQALEKYNIEKSLIAVEYLQSKSTGKDHTFWVAAIENTWQDTETIKSEISLLKSYLMLEHR